MSSLALVGEAWGEKEEKARAPFVGTSGWALTAMLEEAGIHRADCLLTNVFNLRPVGDRMETLCGPKKEGIGGFPPLLKGKHIRLEFKPELERLADELVEFDPNVIVALGNTALWALCGRTGVRKLRGTTLLSTHSAEGFKVLSCYHPAAVLRQWELRPTTVMDLMKAKRESEYPEIRRPERQIWIEPNLENINEFIQSHIRGCRCLSVDIETAGNQVTCIGFAPRKDLALVVPFVDHRRKNRSYWESKALEVLVWKTLRKVLEDPGIEKVFQNGLYDIAFLIRVYGIRVRGAEHDTMLCHHALQPESLKALDYLGSIYCDESAWKQERKHTTTLKRDE